MSIVVVTSDERKCASCEAKKKDKRKRCLSRGLIAGGDRCTVPSSPQSLQRRFKLKHHLPTGHPLTKFTLEPQNLTIHGNLLPRSHCAQEKRFGLKPETCRHSTTHLQVPGSPGGSGTILSHVFTRRNELKEKKNLYCF
jgi:hypothetical protein